MRELEQRISEWRQATSRVIGSQRAQELESHLRDTIDELVKSGVPESEAFTLAVKRLGDMGLVAVEFEKLPATTWWALKLGIGLWIFLAIAAAAAVMFIWQPRSSTATELLAPHVFAVTMGYMATLMLGAVGCCYVAQRFFADVSPATSNSSARAVYVASVVAAGLTATAIVLGMLWAKAAWGRYWGWDPKESWALALLTWQIFFLAMQRARRFSIHTILLLSILGNLIATFAWFAPISPGNYHALGRPLFLIPTAIYAVCLFVGLNPQFALRRA